VFEGVKITLDKWEQHVQTLKRIHKSHLINMQYVSGYQPNPFSSEGYHVIFRNCDDLLVISKTKKDELVRELESMCQFL
jgi:DNA-binding LytR/AlgR family response regulator